MTVLTEGFRFDPLEAPGLLGLLGRHRAVAIVAARGGFVGWHYDPAHRIHTPAATVHATAADALHAASVYLLDKADVREELEGALAIALEERAKAVAKKGATA